jgi:cellulose synthase/poly-beta-1,6-N-acetylglucosamine synthase-like glycosyltransferase
MDLLPCGAIPNNTYFEMSILYFLYAALAALLAAQLLYPFVMNVLSQWIGKERLTPTSSNTPTANALLPRAGGKAYDYGCIITAYKNVEIARPLVDSLLKQTYQNHIIYLVADECDPFDFGIADERFVPLRPRDALRLKAKSIIYAIRNFRRDHDYIAVFDADNLAHPKFLEEINRYANAGHLCIQGQRTAKNLDSTFAALDSMGEHYKNYVERQVPYLLGGSAVISGSGMATEAGLYKAYLASPEIERGKEMWKKMMQEDKILQNFILREGKKIAYARNAIVYDEKVDSGQAVETQRSRWLFSYFQNIPNSVGFLLHGLFTFNWNRFYFGFVTSALPMFIQVGIAAVLALLGLMIHPFWSLVLVGAICIFGLNVLWTLRLDEAPKPVWDAVVQVPSFVLRQFGGLLKMGNPNKNFKHTEHKKFVSVEDMLKGANEKK